MRVKTAYIYYITVLQVKNLGILWLSLVFMQFHKVETKVQAGLRYVMETLGMSLVSHSFYLSAELSFLHFFLHGPHFLAG